MPGNIRRIAWVTRDGRRRRIRLYEVWVNLRGRITGGKSRQPHYWTGLQNEFYSWERFREWALKNGYRKGVQLDRINAYRGYAPDNCQFLTAADHARKSGKKHPYLCPCHPCRSKPRRAYIPPDVMIDPEIGF